VSAVRVAVVRERVPEGSVVVAGGEVTMADFRDQTVDKTSKCLCETVNEVD
jgi:hypothetical protein